MISWLAAALLAASPGAALTEDGAVEQAAKASPALEALARRVEEERAEADASARLENPTLRVQHLRSDRLLSPAFDGASYPNYPFEGAKVGLRWSPPKLGEWDEQRAKAGVEVARSEAELEQGRRDFAARVRSLHATVVGLDAQRSLLSEAAAKREALRAQVEKRREEHVATRLDLDLVGLEVLDSNAGLQELESRRRAAHDELAALLGADPGAALELSAQGVPECAEPEPLAALVERAKQGSPQARRTAARRAAVEAERSKANFGLVPWFDYVQLSYVARGDESLDHAELSFGLTLPLLEWGCADRRMLDARAARIADQDAAESAELGRRVRAARARVLEQAGLVACYRQAEPAMASSVETLSKASEARELELSMLTRVEARVLKARRSHQKARMECRLAQIELARLLGP